MNTSAIILGDIRVEDPADLRHLHWLRHPAGDVTTAMTWCGRPLRRWSPREGGNGEMVDCRRCQKAKP